MTKHLAIAAVLGLCALFGGISANAGVMLGAHVGTEGDPSAKADFVALETAIGRKFAIDNDHEVWGEFPNSDRVRWDVQNGRLSMLSWRIGLGHVNSTSACATSDAIVAGTYDGQLTRQAAAARALGAPILVRFNYEMTGAKEHTCFTGFEVRQNPAAAGRKYIAAWKHVVDVFRAANVTNVKWVWAPGHNAYEKGLWRLFYPGDAYVDWIGVDDYNQTDTPASFADDPGILAFYGATSRLGKPLMVAETGAINDPRLNPDAQTVWLNTARDFVKSHPAIKAFVYWNDPGKFEKENPGYGGSGYFLRGAGLAAFKAMADDPYFR